MPTATDVRNYTGLTTDEVSDAILNTFITNATDLVRDLTGKAWIVGEPGQVSADEAVLFFAAQRAFLRANFPDRAREAERAALQLTQGLAARFSPGPLTR